MITIDFIRLNVDWVALYKKLKNKKDFPKGCPMCSSSKEDYRKSGKYCKFYKDNDHLMEDCLQLSQYFNGDEVGFFTSVRLVT